MATPPVPSPLWPETAAALSEHSALLRALGGPPKPVPEIAARLSRPAESLAQTLRAWKSAGLPLRAGPAGWSWHPECPVADLPQTSLGAVTGYLPSCASTQDLLAELARRGAPHGSLILSEAQTAGRGRLGRRWVARAGEGLYLSLLLRPPLPAPPPVLSLMAAVALQESCGLGSLKWPNDLLDPSGKKLAGILLEARWSGELDFLLIGIGVNVRAGSWPDGAAAVGAWRWVNRARLLRSLLESLECWWGKPPEAVLRRWWELSAHRGKPVALRRAGVLLTGLADGLEPDGSLRVIGANGTARISAGEVAWIGGLE